MMTLEEAKAVLAAGVDKGIKCPCCNRFNKLYHRQIYASLAKFSILAYKRFGCDWFHINTVSAWYTGGGDYGKLAHWGLLEYRENFDEDKASSGWVRISEKGAAFVQGEISIPKYVYLLNNEVQDFSDELVTIYDCLGKSFSYRELMDS